MGPIEVDIDQLEVALAAGTPLIDVRQPEEYVGAHVAEARLVPLGEVSGRMDEIPSEGPVYVICHSGGRSLKVAQFLRNHGVEAYSVDGGTKAWVESGRPYQEDPSPV